jgi:hypothetical protein
MILALNGLVFPACRCMRPKKSPSSEKSRQQVIADAALRRREGTIEASHSIAPNL